MPNVLNRKLKHRPRKLGRPTINVPPLVAPIGIASVTKAAAVMTIVFNQPVALKGVPQYTTNLAGVTPVSAAMTNAVTLALTFSATVATATTLNIPNEDPAIRNPSGGFVSHSTFPA